MWLMHMWLIHEEWLDRKWSGLGRWSRYCPSPIPRTQKVLPHRLSRGALTVPATRRRFEQFGPAFAIIAIIAIAGCQTPQTTTVAPPATGMIGQPAAFGGWATQPQGAAYPPTISAPPMPGAPPAQMQAAAPMPGPATQWQSASPAQAPNSWSWSQPPATQPPSLQQYGTQLQNSANQAQQNVTAQTQQYANQLQAQPQQWANQSQQALANQQQQYTQQLQNTANQYQQGFNNQLQQANTQVPQQMQAGQQQLNNGFQQTQQAVTAQMPQYPQQMPQAPAPTQPSTSWNPFATSGSSLPPARGTPAPGLPSY